MKFITLKLISVKFNSCCRFKILTCHCHDTEKEILVRQIL